MKNIIFLISKSYGASVKFVDFYRGGIYNEQRNKEKGRSTESANSR